MSDMTLGAADLAQRMNIQCAKGRIIMKRVGIVIGTNFRWLGPDDKIVVDGFDDPKVQGVACHIARAQTGGVKGAMGVAEDTGDASIACRQIGPIQFVGEIKAADPLRFADLSLAVIKLLGPGEYVLEAPDEAVPGHFGLAVKDYTRATAPTGAFRT